MIGVSLFVVCCVLLWVFWLLLVVDCSLSCVVRGVWCVAWCA